MTSEDIKHQLIIMYFYLTNVKRFIFQGCKHRFVMIVRPGVYTPPLIQTIILDKRQLIYLKHTIILN